MTTTKKKAANSKKGLSFTLTMSAEETFYTNGFLAKKVKQHLTLINKVLKNPNNISNQDLDGLVTILEAWSCTINVRLDTFKSPISEDKKTIYESLNDLFILLHSERDLSISDQDILSLLNTVSPQNLMELDEAGLTAAHEEAKRILITKSALKLMSRYMKSAIIMETKSKFSMSAAQSLTKLSRSQIYNEIRFYKLMHDFPSLFFLDMNFDKIKKNASKIRDLIQDNESFTEIFKKKVKIYSNDTITFLES